MRTKLVSILTVWMAIAVLTPVLGWSARADHALPDPLPPAGVATVTGTIPAITDPYLASWMQTDAYVFLTDMTAFVRRDHNLPLSSASRQVLTGVEGDLIEGAAFSLALPAAPDGRVNDVSQVDPRPHAEPASRGAGVQIYAVTLTNNQIGDGFTGAAEWIGWPWAYSSVVTAPGSHEVTGGALLVWAADERGMFPTRFGPDGLLFTADDPVAALEAGWTLVELTAGRFAFTRDASVDVTLDEGIAANDDYSDLTYTQAFNRLIAQLSDRYPFTDAKGLDWRAISRAILPDVQAAEAAADPLAFQLALNRLTLLVGDHHFMTNFPYEGHWDAALAGTIGLHVWQSDAGAYIVDRVFDGQPAAAAGIEPGAELLSWNGRSLDEVVAAAKPLFPESSEHARRFVDMHHLARMAVGTTVELVYRTPGIAVERTVTLTAIYDPDGITNEDTWCVRNAGRYCAGPEMAVTFKQLDSGVGYVRVNTFFGDDPVLISRAWESALRALKTWGARALIVDVIGNGGGSISLSNYLAGSFATEAFTLNDFYGIDANGAHHYEGSATIVPSPVRWDGPVAVLIDPMCAAACESFVAAVAHDPNNLIVGMNATAGGFAGIANVILLPDGQVIYPPVSYATWPDSEDLFLEGTGVEPTLRVPATTGNLLNPGDIVLDAAEQALRDRLTAIALGDPPLP